MAKVNTRIMALRLPRPVHRSHCLTLAACALIALAGCTGKHADPQAMARDAHAALARNDWHAAYVALADVGADAGTDPALQVLAARVALEQGDAQRAVLLFEAAGRAPQGALARDDAAALRPLLARAQLALGNPSRALETLGSAEPADPVSAAVKVRALAQSDNAKSAVDLLDRALARWPQSVDLGLLDGVRSAALGDTARADTIARDLLARAPDDFEVVVFAGQRAVVAGRIDEAARIFADANRLRPDHQVPMLGLAAVARARGDKAGEAKWIDRARHAAAGDLAVALYAAQLALDAGHAEDAVHILAPLANKPNGSNALRLLAGLADAQAGHKDDAIDQLTAFLLHGGEDGRARFALAVLLAERGDRTGAWHALKPLAQSANAAPAPLKLAASLAAAVHDPLAPALAQRAAAQAAPDPDAAAMVQAQAAIARKDWAAADAIYARVLAAPRTNLPLLLNNAAYVKIELGQAAAAVPLARRALAAAPDDAVVLDTLGWALVKSGGDRSEALNLLQRAQSLQPSNPSIRAHLAEAGAAR